MVWELTVSDFQLNVLYLNFCMGSVIAPSLLFHIGSGEFLSVFSGHFQLLMYVKSKITEIFDPEFVLPPGGWY